MKRTAVTAAALTATAVGVGFVVGFHPTGSGASGLPSNLSVGRVRAAAPVSRPSAPTRLCRAGSATSRCA